MSIRNNLVKALARKYEAAIAAATATVEIYLDNSVGIGEHPQHIQELDKLMSKIAEAEDKLTIVNQRFDLDMPF